MKWTIDWTNPNDTIAQMAVGDTFDAPSAYGFDTITWEVVGIDKNTTTDTSATHTVTLQTVNLLSKSEDKKFYTRNFDESSQLWHASSIRDWLNEETSPTESRGNFLGSFLLDSDGNPKEGTALAQANAFLNTIKATEVSTYVGDSTLSITNDKVWLPSVYEVGGNTPESSWGAEGNVLDKYSASPGTDKWDVRIKSDNSGSKFRYFLRSACSDASTATWYAYSDGQLLTYGHMYMLGFSPLITLTYTSATHTVTFDSVGGSTVESQTVEPGQTITRPTDPTKDHCTFAGWYTDSSYTTVYDFNTAVTSSFTLYAKWTTITHTVTFDFYRGDVHTTENQTVNDGDAAVAPSGYNTRTHYDFVSWDKILLNITEDQTITAQYTPKKYTITFDSMGGSAVDSQEVEYQGTVTRPTDPTKTGCGFANWYTDEACTALYNFTTPVEGNFTLYAKWETNKYTVTFSYSNEESHGDDQPNTLKAMTLTRQVEHGGSVEPPSDYLLTHWTFKNWDKVLTNITEDQTITAVYEINQYSVTFKYYEGETYKTDTVTDNYGSAITYPTAERTGYDLREWLPHPTYLLSTFESIASYSIKTFDVTFKYHSGTDPDEKTSTQEVQYKNAAVPPTDYEWVGHTFLKWSGDYSSITSDSTFNAIYDSLTYTVAFNSNGGSEVDPQTVTYGQTITKPTNPTKDGYKFGGWYRDEELTIAFSFDDPITTDITLYAKWSVGYYDVTFDFYLGTEHKTETKRVPHGGTAVPPVDFTRTGYDFVQWDKPRTNITEDQTITAEYKIKSYTVVVDYYSGDEHKTDTQTVNYGSDATVPENYARTGYDFVQWSNAFTNITEDRKITAEYAIKRFTVTFKYYSGTTEKTSTQLIAYKGSAVPPTDTTRTGYIFGGWDNTYTNITADVTVNAIYTIRTYTVQVNYYKGTEYQNEYQTVEYGHDATVPTNYQRTGYNFVRWTNAFTNISADTVIDAVYEIKTFTVLFDYYYNDEHRVEEQTVQYGHAAVAPSYYQRTGYNFIQWSCDFASITADTEVVAEYTIKKFTVTFVTDGTPVPTQQVIEYGKKATKPTNPSKAGGTFVAWYSDIGLTTVYDFDTVVTENKTLYSKFNLVTFEVTFSYYSGATAKTEVKTVDYGSTVTAPTDTERTGYDFTGWDKPLTNITSSQTITAQYEKKEYTVSFNTNGGTAIDSQTVKYQECATKPATDPTKTGHTFKGWYTDATYTTAFNFSTKIEADITVYAWMDPFKYTLSFESNGGSSVPSQQVNYGEAPVRPTDPSKTDLRFAGWYTTEELTTVYNFGLPMYADAKAYAKWAEITPTLSKILGHVEGNDFVLDEDDGRYALKLVDEIPEAPSESDTYAIQLGKDTTEYKRGDIFVYKDGEWTKVEIPTETVLSVSNIICPRVNQDVQIRWCDPDDRDPYTWKHTRLLRKYGSYPNDIFDGVIVTDSYVHDQYSKLTFHDFVPPGTEDNWYYRFFTFSEDEVSFSSESDMFRPIELSWETIGCIVQSGLAARVFAIGDTVTVEANSTYKTDAFYKDLSLEFAVVAFNQATPEDATKTNSITFALVDTFGDYTTNWDTSWLEYRLTTDLYVTDRTKVYYIFDGTKFVPATNLPMGKRLTPNTYYEKNNNEERTLHGGNRWASSSLRTWLNATDASTKRVFYDSNGGEHALVPPLVALQSDFVNAVTTTRNTTALPYGEDRVSGDYECCIDKFYLLSQTEVFNVHTIQTTYTITTDKTPKEYYNRTTDETRDLTKTYYIYREDFKVYQKASDDDFNPDGSFMDGVVYYELTQKEYYRYDRTAEEYVVCTDEYFTAAHEFLELDPSDPTGKTSMVYYDQNVSDVEENPYIPYYADEELTPRICHNSSGDAVSWWLRSANVGTYSTVHYTSKSGELMDGDIAMPTEEHLKHIHHLIFGFSIS